MELGQRGALTMIIVGLPWIRSLSCTSLSRIARLSLAMLVVIPRTRQVSNGESSGIESSKLAMYNHLAQFR